MMMKNHAQRCGRPPHCPACRAYGHLYRDIKQIRADQREILNYILDKQEAETKYLDAMQTMDRVGVSESTLLRCQHRGEITVAKVWNRKKYFRDRDVEHLRKAYRGLDD